MKNLYQWVIVYRKPTGEQKTKTGRFARQSVATGERLEHESILTRRQCDIIAAYTMPQSQVNFQRTFEALA